MKRPKTVRVRVSFEYESDRETSDVLADWRYILRAYTLLKIERLRVERVPEKRRAK